MSVAGVDKTQQYLYALAALFPLVSVVISQRVWAARAKVKNQAEGLRGFRELEQRLMERTARLSQDNERLRQELEAAREASRALKRSEKMFRDIATSIGEGIYVLDEQGKICYLNEEAGRLFGWTMDELNANGPHETVHCTKADGSHHPFADCAIHRVMVTGKRYCSDDEVFVRKDGTVFPVAVIAAPVVEQGRVVSAVVAFRDVTGVKKAEESIRRLSLAVEQSPVSILITDHLGRIEFVNPRFSQLTGYSREEALGKSPSLMQSGETPVSVYRELWGTVRAGKVWVGELQNRKKHGEKFWEQVTIAPIFDKAGSITHYMAMQEDISSRKHAERMQRLSERRFRDVLENINLISVIMDRQGTVTFCNDFLLELTGWQREEVLGRDWFTCFTPPESRQESHTHFAEGISSGRMPVGLALPIVTRDGSCRAIAWNITLLHGADDAVAGIAAIGIDMTAHNSLEEQLRHAQKMEAVGQLAGGVAHDFNNILTVILGYCGVLRMHAAADSQLHFDIDQISSAAERAAKLTQTLLAFSRKESMHPRPHNLNDIVAKVQTLLVRLIGEDIVLKSTLCQVPLIGNVDSAQLEQVLINLATNARDAMPKGGLLTITTQLLELDAPFVQAHGYGRPGRFALIAVSDTGVGMDETTRKRVFEPFFTTKEVGKGTGLGMAIVYGVVQQHQGFINVYSEAGQGTTLRIYLPLLHGVSLGQGEEVIRALPHRGTETILVVEDEVAVQGVVERVLTGFGYTVLVAGNGEEGVALFTKQMDRIQLVLMDIIMPRMNGKEACDRLRALNPQVKVLFTSGYTADVIENRGELARGAEIIMKPVQPMELLHRVREMLDQPE